MLRFSDLTFSGAELTPQNAYYLYKELNDHNREVSSRHVANMGLDAESTDDYFLPNLVTIAIALPEKKKAELNGITPANIFDRIRMINDQLVSRGKDGHAQLVNGGHTSNLIIGMEKPLDVQVQLYLYKNDKDLGAIKRGFDKARHRSGRDKMVFTGSTPNSVYNATKMKFTKQELGNIHKAMGPILKGFLVNNHAGHMSEHSVDTAGLTNIFAPMARTYINKVNAAHKTGTLSKTFLKEMLNAGLMGGFVFMMSNSSIQGKVFDFLNEVINCSITKNGKKATQNFKKFLACDDIRVNPKNFADKSTAVLRALEYYWGLFYKYGNNAVPDIIPGDQYIFKTSSHGRAAAERVIFAGLTEGDMRTYDNAFTQRNKSRSDLQKEFRNHMREVQKTVEF